MRRHPFTFLLLLLLVFVGSCSTAVTGGEFLQGSFPVPSESVSAGASDTAMRYLLRFPDGYVRGDDVPLVVFLHGSGDDDYDSEWLTSLALPAVILFDGLPSTEPFALLAPEAAPGTSWDEGGQPDTVAALVDDVVSRFGIDPGRVSLTGWSMGGYGVWHVATRFPDRFARVASVSGSGYGTTDLPDGLDVCALGDVPFRAYHGAADMISPPGPITSIVSEWEKRCGRTIDFRLLDGVGHFAVADLVYHDPDFYRWFLTD